MKCPFSEFKRLLVGAVCTRISQDTTPNYSVKVYQSVEDIDFNHWDTLTNSAGVYFRKEFLQTIEKNHKNSMKFNYILLSYKENPVGLAITQIVGLSRKELIPSCEFERCVITRIKDIFRGNSDKQLLRLLICGNAFLSGEHGMYLSENHFNKESLDVIEKTISEIAKEKSPYSANAILFKDFNGKNREIINKLTGFGYREFHVEPNMVLTLKPEWNTFDDYLAAMKTKFRTKAKSAFKRSASLEIFSPDSSEIEDMLPELTRLYRNVEKKASFKLSVINLKSYSDLKSTLGDDFIIKVYKLDGKIVGFMTGVVNNNHLDAHFVGMDYNHNKTHAIYQRILYDYIDIAIERGLEKVHFGRTASEIKSTVGAEPQQLSCYARHKNPVSNVLVRPLFNYIRPTKWEQRKPFKK